MEENNFKITVYKDEELDAFGAYASGSIKSEQGGRVLLNIAAMLHTSLDVENEVSFKELFVETLMHEVGHALEQWFDLECSEERIERITQTYREKYNPDNK